MTKALFKMTIKMENTEIKIILNFDKMILK